MKASELRIGNWIKSQFGGIQQAVDVMCDGINTLKHEGINYEFIEPIPLTEEWLLKFGFQKDDNGCYWVNLLTHYFELEKSDCFWFPVYAQIPEFSHEKEQRVSLNCIEHVHQLQNLYFALTGEELTFSE